MIKITQAQKNDFILILISISLLILIGFIVFKFSPGVSRFLNPLPQVIGKSVLTIDFGNDKKRAFEGDIVEKENLLDVLYQASKAGSFSYKLDENSDVVFIEDISLKDKKFSKNNNKSWQWYINDKKIIEPPSKISPRDGDNILIKYE